MRYYNTYSGAYRESDSELGYPYVPEAQTQAGAEGTTEVAARTADAILSDVGTDAAAAQAALDAEQARATPRSTLTAKLQKIVDAGAE